MPSQRFRKSTAANLSYLAIGPPRATSAVVLIHGWSCRASDYTRILSHLADNGLDDTSNQEQKYKVIAIDLPGHGESSEAAHTCEPSIAAFARRVLDLVGTLGVTSCVIAGHSMGGRLVLECFRVSHLLNQASIHVRGLVCIDCSSYRLRPGRFSFDARDAQMSATDRVQAKTRAFDQMFSAKTPLPFRQSTVEHVRSRDQDYMDKLRENQIEYDIGQVDDVLADLGHCPAIGFLNIQSTNADAQNKRISVRPDEVTEWMQHIQELVPQARQIVVGDCGHFPHLDEAELVANELMSFADDILNVKIAKP